ncbi:MAG: 2-dehydropantoate 2-reductase [Burkholderiales bacterium]
MSRARTRVAVMGAGAVGGYYGGMLALAGVPVTLVGRAHHVEAIAKDGLAIVRADRTDRIKVAATTEASGVGEADVVLVCVKSSDTVSAARAMKPHLCADAAVISLQNGVANADAMLDVLDQVVLGAAVWVGAYMEAPGVVRHTGRGDLVLGVTRKGAARPHARERAATVAAMFEAASVACPVVDDVERVLWHKLLINCAFNAVSALGRARYGRMARDPATRGVMEAAVREGLAVARATGIALDEGEVLAAVWRTAEAMTGQYSSTAQDILRGKLTEIDMLNGHVAALGAKLGVATPVNRTLQALVGLREAGDDLA